MNASSPRPPRLVPILSLAAGVLCVLFVAAFCIDALLTDSLPEAAVYDVVAEMTGLTSTQLVVDGGGYTHGITGRTGQIFFRVKGEPSRRITVQFAQRIFFPWELNEYRDDIVAK